VRDVVEMTRARWHDAALAQGVAIDVRCELGPVPPISGHAAALREVVTNLILNAVDALPAGGHIVLATRTEGHTAVLTVSDDGVGMSEEVARRAHEPFFTTKGPKGTGLGLSVNYGVIRRHGGEQHIASARGAGTVVTVRLPAAAGAAPVPQAAPAPAAPGPVRVLVVDDEPEVLSLVAEMAKLLGCEAAAAAGSDDAVAALERGPLPDVVLTDHGMPGMTGRELAQVIRRRWPRVRVGLMTGWGDAVTSGPGVDFVLAKPLTLEDLGTRLQAAVAGEPAPTS
jgi:CheY-like chemotaxis protein